MTDKELRKLKRTELLELLFYMQSELESLRQENESLRQQLGTAAGGITDTDLERITSAVMQAMQDASQKQSEAKP